MVGSRRALRCRGGLRAARVVLLSGDPRRDEVHDLDAVSGAAVLHEAMAVVV
jgi:hypothetical protein